MEQPITESAWQKSKLIFKGLFIGVLALLLLIPAYYVQQLVLEREARQKEAVQEVSSKWGGKQLVTPPMLVIPYHTAIPDANGNPNAVTRLAYVLPDKLNLSSVVHPEKKSRGIYKIMLYAANTHAEGKINALPLADLGIQPSAVLWDKISFVMGVTDLRGLRDDVWLTVNGSKIKMESTPTYNLFSGEMLSAPFPLLPGQDSVPLQFSTEISLNGSEQIQFVPTGRETAMEMKSSWADPSFSGNQLPDTSWITDKGFTARWKSVAHNRSYPQAGSGVIRAMEQSAFGADLYIQLNGYQKTIRSLKYAILCVLLTFTAFFLIDTLNKKGVHPLQYALIGCALILFYTLLLSFSEYTGFNTAYWIATLATTGLIAWFVKSLLQSGSLTTVLSVLLVLLYGYVFTILQLEDYALLLGSVGLFLSLGAVMFFTRKLRW